MKESLLGKSLSANSESNVNKNAERINNFYATLNFTQLGNSGKTIFSTLRPLGDFIARIDCIDISNLSDKELLSYLVFCDNFYKFFPTENYALYAHYRFHMFGEINGSSYMVPKTENINTENSIANLFVSFFRVFGFDNSVDNYVCKTEKDRSFLYHFLNLLIDNKKIFAVGNDLSHEVIDYKDAVNEKKMLKTVYAKEVPASRVFYEDTIVRYLNFLIEHYSLEQAKMQEKVWRENIFESEKFNPVLIELYANTYGLTDGEHFKNKNSYLVQEENPIEETFVLKKFFVTANAMKSIAIND